MTSVYRYNNKIILKNGKIGISQNCCCDDQGACCLSEICTISAAFWLIDSNNQIICPNNPPPDPPGWTLISSVCLPGRGRISTFGKPLPCDLTSEEMDQLTQHFMQVSKPLDDPGIYEGAFDVAVLENGCVDGLSKTQCEQKQGTFYAGKTCWDDNPCFQPCYVVPHCVTVEWNLQYLEDCVPDPKIYTGGVGSAVFFFSPEDFGISKLVCLDGNGVQDDTQYRGPGYWNIPVGNYYIRIGYLFNNDPVNCLNIYLQTSSALADGVVLIDGYNEFIEDLSGGGGGCTATEVVISGTVTVTDIYPSTSEDCECDPTPTPTP